MYLGIITTAGKGGPFQLLENPAEQMFEKLRLDTEHAQLIGFTHQNTRTFASGYANAYGKILWHVPDYMIHTDDLPPDPIFESLAMFQVWLYEEQQREKQAQCKNTEPC